MKKKNLIIILCVLVMGIVALVVFLRGSRTATFNQDFHLQDPSTVTRVFISDKQDNNVLLERVSNATGDSAWNVDGQYPASQAMVDLMLETLNTMRIRQSINKTAVPNIVKDIASSSIKVEVYQQTYFINWFGGKLRLFPHEKNTVTYFIGRETQDQMGSYCFREGDKAPYIIHIPGFRGFLSPRFPTSTWAWRSHHIVTLNVKQIERVELEIPATPEESFAVYRQGEGFAMELLQSHQQVNGFDTARVAQLLSSFTNLSFDEYACVVPNADMANSFKEAPRAILRITSTSGQTRELKSYLKYQNPADSLAMPDPELYESFDLNRLYAIIDNTDTVLIQYYTFDNVLQPASFFMGASPSSIAK